VEVVVVKSYAFLFWGYLVVWVGIVGYLAFLGARLSRAVRRVEALERRLDSAR
jgi:CcmD family protein